MKIALILLALMVVLLKHSTDKAIDNLEARLRLEQQINAELIKSTKELLSMNQLIVNGMIKPIVSELRKLNNEKPSQSVEETND